MEVPTRTLGNDTPVWSIFQNAGIGGGTPGGGGGVVFDGFAVFDGFFPPQYQQTTALVKQAWQHPFGGFDGFGGFSGSLKTVTSLN